MSRQHSYCILFSSLIPHSPDWMERELILSLATVHPADWAKLQPCTPDFPLLCGSGPSWPLEKGIWDLEVEVKQPPCYCVECGCEGDAIAAHAWCCRQASMPCLLSHVWSHSRSCSSSTFQASLSKGMMTLSLLNLRPNKLACLSFMDAGRRHKIPRSESKDFMTHSTKGNRSFMIVLICLSCKATGTMSNGPTW